MKAEIKDTGKGIESYTKNTEEKDKIVKMYKLAILIPQNNIKDELDEITFVAQNAFLLSDYILVLVKELKKIQNICNECKIYFESINKENSSDKSQENPLEILNFINAVNLKIQSYLDKNIFSIEKQSKTILGNVRNIMKPFFYFTKYKNSFYSLRDYILQKYGNDYRSLFDEKEEIIKKLDFSTNHDKNYESEDVCYRDPDYNSIEYLYRKHSLKKLSEFICKFIEFKELSLKLYSKLLIIEENDNKSNELEYYMGRNEKLDKFIMIHNAHIANMARYIIEDIKIRKEHIKEEYCNYIKNYRKLLKDILLSITSFRKIFNVKKSGTIHHESIYDFIAIQKLIKDAPKPIGDKIREVVELASKIIETIFATGYGAN